MCVRTLRRRRHPCAHCITAESEAGERERERARAIVRERREISFNGLGAHHCARYWPMCGRTLISIERAADAAPSSVSAYPAELALDSKARDSEEIGEEHAERTPGGTTKETVFDLTYKIGVFFKVV